MGILLIKRKYEPASAMSAYTIYIDGEKRGSVRNGEAKELLLSPGHHTLRVRFRWWSSQPMSLEINQDKKIVLISQKVESTYIIFLVIGMVIVYYLFKMIWKIDISLMLDFVGLYVIAYLFYFFVIERTNYLNIRQL